MFIHWDLSSVAGTEISWSRGGSKPIDNGGDPAGYVADPVYDNLYKGGLRGVGGASRGRARFSVFTARASW